MSLYALDSVFRPASVAVVGASPRPRSLGRLVLQQLRDGGFRGPVGLVNPRHAEIDGVAAVISLQALAFVPELVVIAAPPEDVAGVAAAAADKGGGVVDTRGTGACKGQPTHSGASHVPASH